MNLNNKIFLSIFLAIVYFTRSTQGLTICFDDYRLTNYNLYCSNENEFIIITNIVGAFLVNGPSRTSCFNKPNLESDSIFKITSSLCAYCIDKWPCIFTREIIDRNKLFDLDSFYLTSNANPSPISLKIEYRCLDKALLTLYKQSLICSNPLFVTENPNYTKINVSTPLSTLLRQNSTSSRALSTTSRSSSTLSIKTTSPLTITYAPMLTTFSSTASLLSTKNISVSKSTSNFPTLTTILTKTSVTSTTIETKATTSTRTTTISNDYGDFGDYEENVYCISKGFVVKLVCEGSHNENKLWEF
ncbi:unnamed protein product [Brachionus calyciflorus]|uniref:Uncharacterized protein n=1 Tax=Brachionus calyciflorus TaxID=104777 RepID=A0A813M9N8_9BILA|nr:unnamed protein product [Brachionus calyciflorus]